MRHEIFGGNLPAVIIYLDRGESIYTQSGGLTWMSDQIKMETNMKGGFLKGFGRMLTGDSLFMASYTAEADGQYVTIASSFPGTILPLNVGEGSYICQKSAFLCAQPEVSLSVYIPPGVKGAFFGGEGLAMQEVTGNGLVFLEIDGSVRELNLQPGERIKVNTGNVAAYQKEVKYSAEVVKGFKNMLFGGEGLFLTTLEGPGKVYLQTITMAGFTERLIPFLPKKD